MPETEKKRRNAPQTAQTSDIAPQPERQETEIIDAEEVRRQAKKRRHMKDQDVDNMLLTRSLKEEFKKDK